jgi:hypothetical protein
MDFGDLKSFNISDYLFGRSDEAIDIAHLENETKLDMALPNNESSTKMEEKRSKISNNRKEQNKYYAKLNRRRKKEYTVELENKIWSLEKENSKLKEKIGNLEAEIMKHTLDNKVLDTYKELEDYTKNGLVKDLSNTIIEADSRFRYFSDLVGPAAFDRQKVIKTTFGVIIDSILPSPMKQMISLQIEGTAATQKDYERVFNYKSKYSAYADLKNPKFGEIDRVFYEIGIDPKTRGKLLAISPKIAEFKASLQEVVYELIRLRNKLLIAPSNFNMVKILLSSNINPSVLANIIEHCNKIPDKSRVSKFNLWGIKKKQKISLWNGRKLDELTDEESD